MKKLIILPIIYCLISSYSYANYDKEKLDDAAISSLTETNSSFCYSLHVEYHLNGQIKEKGCQGFFNGQGVLIGDLYEYDVSGSLVRVTYFHPDEFGKDYKIVKEYDQNETIVSEKIFNYDYLYGVEEKELDEIPN